MRFGRFWNWCFFLFSSSTPRTGPIPEKRARKSRITLPITSTVVVLLAECPCLLFATHVYAPESTPFCTDNTVSMPSCKSVFCLKSSGSSLSSATSGKKFKKKTFLSNCRLFLYWRRLFETSTGSGSPGDIWRARSPAFGYGRLILAFFPSNLINWISSHRTFDFHIFAGHGCNSGHRPHVRVACKR